MSNAAITDLSSRRDINHCDWTINLLPASWTVKPLAIDSLCWDNAACLGTLDA